MWKRLLVIIILLLIERVGVPFPMSLSYMLALLSIYASEDKSCFPLAFMAGMAMDMVFINKLGMSAIVLLLVRGVLVYLNNRFKQGEMVVLAITAVVASLGLEWWAGNGLRLVYAISSGLGSVAVYWWLKQKQMNLGGIYIKSKV